ncbi:MAG: protein-ADP-ribose hydrolase [Anaeroplasmataceae bacterium]|nr:protein-ADP-ribose hydrolase [Anaeroplasmataceae bacterium]MDE6414941.1 protein-ADP-ribose hydrolase [Anaeroplasmataceae bacterium]
MNQEERRIKLIEDLLFEQNQKVNIPKDKSSQELLLRGLMNIRMPRKFSEIFINTQNTYLQERLQEKGITDINCLNPIKDDLYLWRGDITTLKCDAIVNAANSQMLGCFIPNHRCIDNAIHTYAGIELREECFQMMKKLGREAEVGEAFLTKAYNLPSRYVIHTVGPFVSSYLTEEDKKNLQKCYLSCLKLAEEHSLDSIAFCCISTGEFHFPNDAAGQIAVETVKQYKEKTQSKIKVIFNVFKELDYDIYKRLLS